MTEVQNLRALANSLGQFTYQDLLRIKWAAEHVQTAVRQEMLSRDARVVDELCNLEAAE